MSSATTVVAEDADAMAFNGSALTVKRKMLTGADCPMMRDGVTEPPSTCRADIAKLLMKSFENNERFMDFIIDRR